MTIYFYSNMFDRFATGRKIMGINIATDWFKR